MSAETLAERAQDLTDIELAVLLCLVSSQHCIVETNEEAVTTLSDELQLIAANGFGLSRAVLQCSESTSLENFVEGILVDNAPTSHHEQSGKRSSLLGGNASSRNFNLQDDRKIAELVIITNLHNADEDVQIQALELLRTGRVFTNTAIYTSRKTFCMVFVNAKGAVSMVQHLVDHIFISHYHDPSDGFPNLEEASGFLSNDDNRSSTSSSIRPSSSHPSPFAKHRPLLFTQEDITHLSHLTTTTTLTAEIHSYILNVVVFLRLNRAVVATSISPRATGHFELLTKCLAPLHGLDYVTPSLVVLAARKVYPHRLRITEPERERSMQWGSELEAVRDMLDGLTPQVVVDEVLGVVPAPL